MSSFKPATRRSAKLRIALQGTSGAGKTYSALQIAKVFGGRIAVMDSERGSASLYSHLVQFDVAELEENNIQNYIAKVREAAEAGYDVLVIDSYSHSWLGALEAVDKMGGSKFSNGWKSISPLVTKLVDTILNYPGHVIATMRSKSEYVVEQGPKGSTPRKVGMAPVAREGTDYEFSVVLDLTKEGGLTVAKTRCSALEGEVYTRDDVTKIAEKLKAWLSEGAPMTPRDSAVEKIRFADSLDSLKALGPVIAALPPDDREALKAVYLARREALASAAPAADDALGGIG